MALKANLDGSRLEVHLGWKDCSPSGPLIQGMEDLGFM